jgi:hypothetical protein
MVRELISLGLTQEELFHGMARFMHRNVPAIPRWTRCSLFGVAANIHAWLIPSADATVADLYSDNEVHARDLLDRPHILESELLGNKRRLLTLYSRVSTEFTPAIPFSDSEKNAIRDMRDGKKDQRRRAELIRRWNTDVSAIGRGSNFNHTEWLLLILWLIVNDGHAHNAMSIIQDINSGFAHRTLHSGLTVPNDSPSVSLIELYRTSKTIALKLEHLQGPGRYLMYEGVKLLLDPIILRRVVEIRNLRASSRVIGGCTIGHHTYETLNPARNEVQIQY